MRITVRLYGGLRRYRPPDAAAQGPFTVEAAAGATVAMLGEQLGIPGTWVRSVFVNGEQASKDRLLAPGDEVVLFPPSGGGAPGRVPSGVEDRDGAVGISHGHHLGPRR